MLLRDVSQLNLWRKELNRFRRSVENRECHSYAVAVLSGDQQLMELDGVDEDVLGVLHTANVHSPEDLIKTPIEQIATTTGIDMGDLARLRQRAISWLSEVAS